MHVKTETHIEPIPIMVVILCMSHVCIMMLY